MQLCCFCQGLSDLRLKDCSFVLPAHLVGSLALNFLGELLGMICRLGYLRLEPSSCRYPSKSGFLLSGASGSTYIFKPVSILPWGWQLTIVCDLSQSTVFSSGSPQVLISKVCCLIHHPIQSQRRFEDSCHVRTLSGIWLLRNLLMIAEARHQQDWRDMELELLSYQKFLRFLIS